MINGWIIFFKFFATEWNEMGNLKIKFHISILSSSSSLLKIFFVWNLQKSSFFSSCCRCRLVGWIWLWLWLANLFTLPLNNNPHKSHFRFNRLGTTTNQDSKSEKQKFNNNGKRVSIIKLTWLKKSWLHCHNFIVFFQKCYGWKNKMVIIIETNDHRQYSVFCFWLNFNLTWRSSNWPPPIDHHHYFNEKWS